VRSANRILGTLGHRGWRMKRAWALSHAWDWWRADCSRRLVMGSLRRACEPTATAEKEEGGGPAFRPASPPSPAELADLGVLVSFPAPETLAGGGEDPSAPPRGQLPP
jgi:hypothetical protein